MTARRSRAIFASRRRGSRAGFALLVVLMLTMVLAISAAALATRTSSSYRLAQSRATGWDLYFAATAAIEEAKADVWRQWRSEDGRSGLAAAPESRSSRQGEANVTVIFEDEAGKFPVNAFANAQGPGQKELVLILARLLDTLDLPNSTRAATSVRDFLDKDSEGMRERGAKNQSIFDLSELLAVDGFDMDKLYSAQTRDAPPVARCITTWHVGKVNINTAPAVVLQAIEPNLTDGDAEVIIAARKERPFEEAADLTARLGISGEAAAGLVSKVSFITDVLTLRAEARRGAFVRRVEAVVQLDESGAHTLFLRDGWQETGR